MDYQITETTLLSSLFVT